MADLSALTLPHGTIPTQMFGNVNLQNAVMFINENFKELLSGANANTEATTELLAGKAESGHNHDEAYAAYGHIHSWQDISGLQSMLDGKADLNHEHSKYLSSLPAHYHDINSVQGLVEMLQGKAEKTHGHTIAQVENLATELGVKASISYVDQQIGNISGSLSESTKTIIEGYASDKTDVTKTPKDAVIRTNNETDEQKKARIGTSVNYAREDHQHVIDTETSDITKLKHDGNGTGGAASLGTGTVFPRIDHSHPLNYPDGKPTSIIARDGMGAGGTAMFGDTNYYADLGHSHPLNVTSTTPPDISKSAGSAGDSEYYARANHTHKLPTLNESDITDLPEDIEAIEGEVDNHETRITALENAPAGGTVTSVDGVAPVNGNVQLNALTESDIDDTVQAHSDKLDALDDALDANGKVPLSQLTGNISGHSGNCLVTIDNDGVLGHSGNKSYNALQAVADDFNETTSSLPYAKFGTQPTGGKFVKTNADGTSLEVDANFEGLTDTAPQDTGSQASAGSSNAAARADHVHKLGAVGAAIKTASGMWTYEEYGLYSWMLHFFPPQFDVDGRFVGVSSSAAFSLSVRKGEE